MSKTNKKGLIGMKLDGYIINEFTEVYRVNDDGRKTKTIGFFRNEAIAKAFAHNQTDANWHRTAKVLVITNGEKSFLLGEEITILGDEQAALEVREKALAKLTPEERTALGL